MTGTVSKADARLGLRAFFRSDKSDEELAELLRALDRDAPGDSVDYEALLADDDNLDQGEFAELARDQLLAAREAFAEPAQGTAQNAAQVAAQGKRKREAAAEEAASQPLWRASQRHKA